MLSLNIFLTFSTAWEVFYNKRYLLLINYIIKPTSWLIRFKTSCGSCILHIVGVEKCFRVKDGDGLIGGKVNCCTVLWLMCIRYLNKTLSISSLAKGLTLSMNCFISARNIFLRTLSADNSPTLRGVEFSSFSFINLEMPVIIFISASLILVSFNFFVLYCFLPFSFRLLLRDSSFFRKVL